MPSLAPTQADDVVDGRVHVGMEGRAGALEDPGQPNGDELAGADRRVVRHLVEGEAEPLAGPVPPAACHRGSPPIVTRPLPPENGWPPSPSACVASIRFWISRPASTPFMSTICQRSKSAMS